MDHCWGLCSICVPRNDPGSGKALKLWSNRLLQSHVQLSWQLKSYHHNVISMPKQSMEQPGSFEETLEHLAEPEGAPRDLERNFGQGHGVTG